MRNYFFSNTLLILILVIFLPACGTSGSGSTILPPLTDSSCSFTGSLFDSYNYQLSSEASIDVLELSGAEFVDRNDGRGGLFYLIADSNIDQRIWVVDGDGSLVSSLHDGGSIAYTPAIDGEALTWRGGDMFTFLDESGHVIYECDNVDSSTTSIDLLTDCRSSILQQAVGHSGYLEPEGIEYDSRGFYYVLEQSTAVDEGGVWKVTIGNNTDGYPDDETRLFYNSDVGGLLSPSSNANDLAWNGCHLFILSRGDRGNAVVSEVDTAGQLFGEFVYSGTEQREGLAFDFTNQIMMMVGESVYPQTNIWTYKTTSPANACTLTYEQPSGEANPAAIGNPEDRNAYRGIYYTGKSKEVCSAEVKFALEGDVSRYQLRHADLERGSAKMNWNFDTLYERLQMSLPARDIVEGGMDTHFTFSSPVVPCCQVKPYRCCFTSGCRRDKQCKFYSCLSGL